MAGDQTLKLYSASGFLEQKIQDFTQNEAQSLAFYDGFEAVRNP